MSQTSSKQAFCKNCKAVGVDHPISWNEVARANLQTRKPLNMDGTIHECPNYKPQNQAGGIGQVSQQSPSRYNSAPNPSGYTGTPTSPPPLTNPAVINDQPYKDDIYTIMEEIITIKQRQEEMYKLIHDWIVYNPIAASHTQFITDMIRGKEDTLPTIRSASELKKDSMNSDDVNPLPNA